MKYFKDGLSVEELKQEYRTLAKKHHPDLGGDTATMQEINSEYDAYYERLTKPAEDVGAWNFWDLIRRNAEEAKKSREFIVFIVKNEERPGQYVAFGQYGWYDTYFPSKNWADVHEGFAKVSIDNSDGRGDIITGHNVTLEAPSYKAMAKECGKVLSRWGMEREKFSYAETPYGSYYIDAWGTIFASVDGVLTKIDVADVCGHHEPKEFTSKDAIKESYTIADFHFLAYQDCTFDEFCHYHDVDVQSQFHSALLMQETKDLITDNPTVSYLLRKGALKVFHSRTDWSLKYGYFDSAALVNVLPNLSINEVESVQDYLDGINKDFDARVRGKIKKGKLKLSI